MKPHDPNKPINYAEKLSALMDGELAEEELESLLDAVEHDPALKKLWHRMHWERNLIVKQSQSSLDTDIVSAVMSQVALIGAPSEREPAEGLDAVDGLGGGEDLEQSVVSVKSKPSIIPFSGGAEASDEGARAANSVGETETQNKVKPFYHVAVAAAVAFITVVSFNGWQSFQMNQDVSHDPVSHGLVSSDQNIPANISTHSPNNSENDISNQSFLVPLIATESPRAYENAPGANTATFSGMDSNSVSRSSSGSQASSIQWIKPLDLVDVENVDVENVNPGVVQSEPRAMHANVNQAVWEQIEPFVMTHTVYSASQTGSGVFSFGRTLDGDTPMNPMVINIQN